MIRIAALSPSRRLAKLALVLAPMVAASVSVALVWQSSSAAFSAQTSTPAQNWSTGTVTLTDDDSGSALFSATNLKHGSTGTRCIVVTSTGSLPSAIKFYGTGLTSTNSLANNISLTITQGSGGNFGSCTGYTSSSTVFTGNLSDFSTITDYSTGRTGWTTAGGGSENRTYQFTYTVGGSAPAGSNANITFTWEAQNT